MRRISTCAATAAIALATLGYAGAGTITENFRYDDTSGQNNGPNITVPTFTYTLIDRTDPDTGVVFDVSMTISPTGGTGNLRTNGGTSDREFGVEGGNAAIEPGEAITAAPPVITITDFAGNDPADVDVSFDGYTEVILYFVGNGGDAARLTDGSTELWSFEGTLDPAENGGSPVTSDDSLFTFGVAGQHGSPGGNALIDLSGFLPQTLVLEGLAHSNPPNTGTNDDLSRLRVDDFRAQFTVTVIPEPAAGVLVGLALSAMSVAGTRQR
ncbi:MAG: hypothetical protein AAGJ46_11685 [Planctomycetota bacterium]